MLLFQACSYVLFAMHLKDKAHVSRKIFSVCLAESSAEHGLSPPLLQSRVMMKSRSSLEMLEDEKRSFFPGTAKLERVLDEFHPSLRAHPGGAVNST